MLWWERILLTCIWISVIVPAMFVIFILAYLGTLLWMDVKIALTEWYLKNKK